MNLEKEFKIIKEFEKKNQKIFNEGKPFNKYRSKKIVYKSKEHLKQLKERFINGRPENKLKKFAENENKKKQVIPDVAIYEFIKNKYSFDDETKNLVKYHHNIAMDAENRIGHYLEEYIYTNIKDKNWIWCTGDVLRSIDFIKKNKKTSWEMLQIKNSDNSENSSSNKVRKGTNIKAWFRRFSTKNETNWDKLVELTKCEDLSEENFLEFLRSKAKT